MTKENTDLVAKNQEAVKQARALSGGGGGINLPYVPMLTVNNKKEKATVEIRGKQKEVEVLPDPGFLVTQKKGDKEYEKTFFGETLEGVVLKVRYKIASKHAVEPKYSSQEFDEFNEVVKVFDDKGNIYAEDKFENLKALFQTNEKNTFGKFKTTYNFYLILYIDVNGEMFRLRLKTGPGTNWFDYVKSFGSDDTYVAYKTNFVISKEVKGDNEYYIATAERGEVVDLSEQIKKQISLSEALNSIKAAKTKKGEAAFEQRPAAQIEDPGYDPTDPFFAKTEKTDEDDDDEIRVDQIPF